MKAVEAELLAEPLSLEPPLEREGARGALLFTTVLGLLVSFGSLTGSASKVIKGGLLWAGFSNPSAWILSSDVLQLAATAVLVGIVIYFENKTVKSIGLRKPTLSDLGLGLALFAAVMGFSAVFKLLLAMEFPNQMREVATKQLKLLYEMPPLVLLVTGATAGLTEEIAARGFAISRVAGLLGRVWPAALIALGIDVAAHIPFWGWRYAILITPAQTLFVLMYVWRGDIMPGIIGHALMDSAPAAWPAMVALSVAFAGQSNVHIGLADLSFRQGDFAQAIAEYNKALQSKPDDIDILRYRAAAEAASGDYVSALSDLDAALRKDPKNVTVLLERAGYYDDL